MQQKLAEKEKANKEEHLRMLAQRAREERGGILPSSSTAPRAAGESKAAMKSSLAAYASGSESGSGSDSEDEDDEESRKLRDQMRADKRRENERDMRMNNMGTEQRAKQLAR
jgi:SNW domain-containing protein 1